MTKRKALLESLYETVHGLRDAGLMSAQTMREFDVLCLPKIKEYSPAQIKRIREGNKASQAVLGHLKGVSTLKPLAWNSTAAGRSSSSA